MLGVDEHAHKINNCAKISIYILAILILITRIYAFMTVLNILMNEQENILIVLGILTLPILWGIYFSVFGFMACQDHALWESRKDCFHIIYTFVILLLIVGSIWCIHISATCGGWDCITILIIALPFWVDTALQIGIGVSINKLYKDKMN